jgi:hypothetical protein
MTNENLLRQKIRLLRKSQDQAKKQQLEEDIKSLKGIKA